MFNLIKQKKAPLREAAEFQPDAIMLESQQPAVPMQIVWWLVIALIVIFIVGACIFKVDKIVGADGKVITTRPPITMKPYELTVVRKVHVRVGDRVKKGDILFEFDPTVNAEDLKRLEEQLASFRANSRRLHFELRQGYKGDYVLPAPSSRDDELQKDIFISRKNYYLSKIEAYDSTIKRYQDVLKTLATTKEKYADREKALKRIEKMMSDLHGKNVVSLKDYLDTEIQTIGMAIQMDQLLMNIVENQQQVKATEAERSAFIRDWQKQMVEDLVTVDRNLISYEKEVPKVRMKLSNTELRAPCSAVVHEIAPFQEGSAVREAEALVTLIPLSNSIEAEINIPAQDISLVRLHDKCRLKFDAFPFQQCGTLDGEIIYISRDAFQQRAPGMGSEFGDDGGRLAQNSQGVTYQARVRISGKFLPYAGSPEILPGMRLRAEIKVGRRTIINYIVNPFVKALDESIREP